MTHHNAVVGKGGLPLQEDITSQWDNSLGAQNDSAATHPDAERPAGA